MVDLESLSPRQREIYTYIVNEIDKKGYPPSVREIGRAVGLKSPASVHNHLKTLEELEFIRRDPSKPRAIEILDKSNKEDEFDNKYKKEMIQVPIVGRVTAGVPILAEENIEDYFPIPTSFIKVKGKQLFMLEIDGESMVNAGIDDGDYVIAQQQKTANNGEIVIALIDNRATVKRFYKRSDYVELRPENPDYDPILVKNVKLLGKVVGLFRNLEKNKF
ncbi:MAG TPA: transcriptional repressor LexA [Halanaerobiales bacterium]|nr:transcriptional repressor LexA [Halanaerobiales bacterium]